MTLTIEKPLTGGKIRAITSKSAAHRLLICAALADRKTELECTDLSKDILATADCLRAFGAKIDRRGDRFDVTPVDRANLPETALCRCGESGSTLRFLIPVAAALGVSASFLPEGRLPERPLSPLYEALVAHGISLSAPGSVPFTVNGRLPGGAYTIAANVSSQFISGLLFALPLTQGESRICLTGRFESRSYVDMTLAALRTFGVPVQERAQEYRLAACAYRSPAVVRAQGDWSNAAFWLCAGAVARKPVTVTGLDCDSLQGDRAVLDILRRFGADVAVSGDCCTVFPSALRGVEIDAENIPDLGPVLAAVACFAQGRTVIYNAARLRIKESDRLMAVRALLNALGGRVQETEDGLLIDGTTLRGGECDSFCDHRIAMTAAIASIGCSGRVTVRNAEAVEKSYPSFWTDFEALGGKIKKGE